MRKTDVLVGLATALCGLVAMSTPANAFFEAATAGATSGPIVSVPRVNLNMNSGGDFTSTVSCVPGTTATGLWTIQNSEETVVTSGTKEQKQPATKVGPHEAITITNWGSCSILVGSGEKASAAFSPCRLQFAQPTKRTVAGQEAFGSVQTDCVIKIGSLLTTITLEQSPENHSLKVVKLTNVTGSGVEIKMNIKKLTFKCVGAGCDVVGLKEGTEASFSTGGEGTESITTAGQKLV